MIWHRSELSKKFRNEFENRITSDDDKLLSQNVVTDIQLDATKQIINLIAEEFDGVEQNLLEFEKVKKGKLSESEFKDFTNRVKSAQNNFLILIAEISPILEQKYAPVYEEIRSYDHRISEASGYDDLNKIKDELAFRYDIPNRSYIHERIVKRQRELKSVDYKFTISEDAINSCERLLNHVKKVQPNYPKRVSRFKKIPLMDFNNDDCDLVMICTEEHVFDFYYRGEESSDTYQLLNGINGK